MCKLCDGKRDLHIVVQALALMSHINYERARWTLAYMSGRFDDVGEMLQESGEDTISIDLNDFLSDDPEDKAIMNAMVLVDMSEDFVQRFAENMTPDAEIALPEARSDTATAFNEFIDKLDMDHDVED